MTETSPVTNVNPINRIKDTTVGPPLPDTIEKVVSLDDGKELGPGEVGELLAYGPQVMKGYWNAPEATAETLPGGGWIRTGDIVSVDEDGYVTILDRKKEMIKYKGYQIAPAELEALLLEHPAVMDSAVIPKRDDESGEIPKAFVLLRQGPGGLAGGPDAVRRRARRAVQEGARDRVRGGDPEDGVREDPAARADRAGAGEDRGESVGHKPD